MEYFALGIDIGGTTTTFGLVNREGFIHYEKTLGTKDYSTANELLTEIFEVLKSKDLVQGILGLGIGAPNGNAKTGKIEFAPNLNWKGIVPICEIAEAIFQKPCILINDANAAAIGEKMFGKAKNASNFVSITLGTGLGSGIFINNELVEGANGFAGEFGHIRVVPEGRICGCGRKGCLETYASSTGVVRTYEEMRSNLQNSMTYPETRSAKDIFNAAKSGDELCQNVVDFTAKTLGNALADFACFSDPEMFILFGGIAQSGEEFATNVEEIMNANILKVLENKIRVQNSSLHQQNAAVLGTAASIFWKVINKN